YLSGIATPNSRRNETASTIPAARNRPTVVVSMKLKSLRSIFTRQVGLVGLDETHPAAPVAVHRGLARRQVVQSAGWNDHPRAVPRCVRDWTIAVAADLPRETLGFGQIEAFDQILSLSPAKLSDRHADIGRAHAAG